MKTQILFFLLLSIQTYPNRALAQKSYHLPEPVTEIHNQINVGVLPQIELISIIQTISKYNEVFGFLMAANASEYQSDVLNYFKPFENHEAVQLFNQLSLRPRMLNFNAPSFLMLHTDENFKLRTDILADDFVISRAARMDSVKLFFSLLHEFAVQSDFNRFFDEHRDYYQMQVDKAVQNMGKTPYIDELEQFYGFKQKSYNLVLVSLYGSVGYGNSLAGTDSKCEIYNIMGPKSMENGIPFFGDENYLKYMIRHEFRHPFVNPLTEKYWEYIKEYSARYDSIPENARKNVCGDWQECINEFVIRSVTTYLAAKTSRDEGDNYYEKEKSRGVSYLDGLLKKINFYESNRKKYPTFESFYYLILDEFREENME